MKTGIQIISLALACLFLGCSTFNEIPKDQPNAIIQILEGHGYVSKLNGKSIPEKAMKDGKIRVPPGPTQMEIGLKIGSNIHFSEFSIELEPDNTYLVKSRRSNKGGVQIALFKEASDELIAKVISRRKEKIPAVTRSGGSEEFPREQGMSQSSFDRMLKQ